MFSLKLSLNFLFLLVFILPSSICVAETISFKGLILSDYWIKNVISSTNTTSGYIKIENKNEKNERLISVESNFSKRTELHYVNIKNDIVIMKYLEKGLLIKSKSQLNLKPGSFHIMFIDLSKSFNKTRNQKVKFNFENAGSIIINMPIINKVKISKDKKKHHHH